MAYSAKCSLFATFVAKYKPYYGKKGSQALRLAAFFINSKQLMLLSAPRYSNTLCSCDDS